MEKSRASEAVSRVTLKDTVWIVDYDLPLTSRRRQFYRELSKLRRQLGLHGKMSTMSVLITHDRDLAYRVYELALKYGRAHIYRAIKLE